MTAEPQAAVPERLADRFTEAFGHEPAGVWTAPGRVNLIGEHTDYNGGFVLPIALPYGVYVAARARDDGLLLARSRHPGAAAVRMAVDELAPGSAGGWASYVAGVAWALRSAGHAPGGAEIFVDSTLPAGSGLSSSAALECATALAFNDLWSLAVARDELARLAQRAENDFVGMPCGVMDQMASLRCTAGHALFLDCRDLGATPVPLDLEREALRLLVVDTRAPHRHVDGEYASRRRGCERAAAALGVTALRDLTAAMGDAALKRLDEESRRYVRHVLTENDRVLQTVDLLRRGDVAGVGPLLTQSHVSLRDDYRVSSPELNVTVDAALAAGAYGARLTGGGFGGCAIALVGAESAGVTSDAVRDALSSRGFTHPQIFSVVPAAGACRLG